MLACSKKSKETSMAVAEWAGRRVVGDKFRDNRAPDQVESLKPLLGLILLWKKWEAIGGVTSDLRIVVSL